jgi:hypothetical protein
MIGKRKQPQTKLERRRNARPQRARVVRSSVRPKTAVSREKPSKKSAIKSISALIAMTALIIWSGFIGRVAVSSSPKSDIANR